MNLLPLGGTAEIFRINFAAELEVIKNILQGSIIWKQQ
jgi:hypothetical protein